MSPTSARCSQLPKPLENLRAAAQAKRNADNAYRKALGRALDAGHTVQQVADAAGITRSAVYQQLNRKESK